MARKLSQKSDKCLQYDKHTKTTDHTNFLIRRRLVKNLKLQVEGAISVVQDKMPHLLITEFRTVTCYIVTNNWSHKKKTKETNGNVVAIQSQSKIFFIFAVFYLQSVSSGGKPVSHVWTTF